MLPDYSMRLAASTLVICVSALATLGLVMLYSAGMTQDGGRLLVSQLVWCVIGVSACLLVAWLDYRWMERLAIPMVAVAIILLTLVLVPHIGGMELGKMKNGARRWFDLGFAMFQPSELGKLALVAGLAWYCARYHRRMREFWRGLVWPGAGTLVLITLIFLEPDRGCTVLLAGITGVILVVAGVRLWYIIPPACAFVTAFGFALWLDPVMRARLLAFLHPELHKEGAGFQTYQGLVAFSSGGWLGRGLGSSRQKTGFLPFHSTDFIFPIIGEELGLISTLLVVLGFMLVFVCGLYIASRARDVFGRLLGTGVTFLISFQALINIGVVTSMLPNKGMPLPFISYGGSNLLLMLICVGVLLSIARHSLATESAPLRPLEAEAIASLQPT
jgi:cell division protein FtsW